MKQAVVTGPSLAKRLMAALAVAYLLAWVAMLLVFSLALYRGGSGHLDASMALVGDAVAACLIEQPDGARQRAALAGVSATLLAQDRQADAGFSGLAFQVYDATGVLLAQGGRAWPERPVAVGDAAFFDEQQGDRGYRVHQRFVGAPRAWRIDVTQAVSARREVWAASIFNATTLAQWLLGLPLVLLPALVAVHTGLSPLRRLSRELMRRRATDLAPISVDPPYRELAPMVSALNETLARLDALLQRERALVADAAHELRTPLAVIANQADTLARASGPAERAEAAERLQRGIERGNRLVQQLLSLARLSADAPAPIVELDLADAARDALAALGSLAAQREIELTYVGADSLKARVPALAVESVLENLVTNAVRYGRGGGQVEVSLNQTDSGEVTLAVSDDGPGLAENERQRAFDRFWRGRTDATGSGLGLAIVQAAAHRLGARVSLEDGLPREPGAVGLCVRLVWRGGADPPVAR